MTYEELVSAVREVRELLYSHRHLGNDLTAKLRATTVSQLTVVNSSLLGDGVGQSGTLTMSLAPNQGDVYIRAVIDAGDFANTGAKTGFILGIDDSDSDTPKFYFGSPSNYIKYDGSTLTVAGALTASSINIPDTTTANSFHVDTSGNAWWGSNVAGGLATATAKILNTGAATFTNVTITGGAISVGALNLANRGWTQTCAFSVTDADTVAWGAGSFVAADGTTYSIDAGNTGNMVAKTFIYLDAGVSTTVYQTTTTAATAVGAGKVLIAVAQNATGEATYEVMAGQGGKNIDASSIVANSITANELSTSITYAGQIIVSTAGAIRSGQTDYNTGTGWWLGNSGGTPKFSIGVDTGSRITWDGSTLSIVGNASNQKILTYAESITAGQALAIGIYPSNPITYDSSATNSFLAAATSHTVTNAITVGNNSNRILYVVIQSASNSISTPDANTTASFNGDAMTFLGTDNATSDSGNQSYISHYVLVAPDVATGDIVFGAIQNGESYSWFAYSVYGCKQTGVPNDHAVDAKQTPNAGGTDTTDVSVTSTSLGCLSIALAVDQTLYNASGAIGNTGIMIPLGDLTLSKTVTGNGQAWSSSSITLEAASTPVEAAVLASAKTRNVTDYWATTNYKSKAFIGFAAETGTAGQTKAVAISGEATGLSSILLGEQYYLSDTYGAISRTAGTNTRKAAIGTSSTTVLITNIW